MEDLKDLQIFSYNSNEVRIFVKDGEPWWVLRDIAEVLEIKRPSDTLTPRLNPKGVDKTSILSNRGGMQETTIINEENLYRALLRSNKAKAEPFIAWVTGEVLPTIRKKGGYGLPGSTEARLDRIESFMEKTFASIPTLLAETVKQTIKALPQAQILKESPQKQIPFSQPKEEDYLSISQFAKKINKIVTYEDRQDLGKMASKLSRSKNIKKRTIPNERYPNGVGSYHISILKQVFAI